MKNKGIIVTLIILLFIMIIILTVFLIYALNGNFKMFSFGIGKGKKGEIIFDETYEIKDVDNIAITSQAGDVVFEESNDDTIRVIAYGKDSDSVDVSLKNGNLKIDYSREEERNSIFNFDFYTNDTIIYIPNTYEGKIDIKNNYGDIKSIDLENANLKVDADCGDIQIGNIKDVKIKCDYGDINIGAIMNSCTIDASCGDIKIKNVKIKEDSVIKCDYGDIKIEESEDVYIDANVDFGEVKIKENDRHSEITLKIDADCGDIKVGN